MNLRPLMKTLWDWAKRNSTKLLAGGAIGSEIFGFWLMHKEAPIVRDRLDELGDDATWKEKFKAAGPVYLPAAGMLLLSIGCIAGGCAVGEKKAALIASLYSASQATLQRTEQELIEAVGPEKAQEIHRRVANDILKDNPMDPTMVEETGKGKILFFDPLAGRYFRSSPDAVKNDTADFKNYVLSKCFGSVNDWYEHLGIRRAKLGDSQGWLIEHNIDMWLDEGHHDCGELCWVIRHLNEPVLYNGKRPKNFNECENCYIE